MKKALYVAAFAMASVGAALVVHLARAAMKADWSTAWMIFTFAVGSFWISAILVRGSKRLK